MSLSRSLSRPLSRSLSRGLTAGGASLDPDAEAYIAAVQAAGVDDAQLASLGFAPWVATQFIINDFYVAAKEDYYTSLKRLYLPIWGVAAANALDMITLASGTFNGGVTHGAGFIQGNGTTGYFDFGVSPLTLGLTTSSISIGALVYQAESRTGTLEYLMGSNNSANGGMISLRDSTTNIVDVAMGIAQFTASAGRNGVFIGNRTAPTVSTMNRRTSGGFVETTGTTTGTTITSSNTFLLARSNVGIASGWTDAQVGLAFIGDNFSIGTPETVTLHLKTLWEGCTGLTLP